MSIKLKGSSDGSVSFDAPADTSPSGSDITLVLPTTVGSAEQFLKNSGTAGTLEFSSMVETSTGVGIGTSSPSQQLHIASANTSSSGTIIASDSQGRGILIQSPYIGNSVGKIGISGTDSALAFGSGSSNSERLRIDSSGNVGIGTTSPSSKFETRLNAASGTVGLFGLVGQTNNPAFVINLDESASTVTLRAGATASAGQNLAFNTGVTSSERMRIDSSGTLTVGPQYDRLNVNPGSGSYDGDPTAVVIDGRTNDGSATAFKIDRYDGSGSASTKFLIDYAGNVGIGNSSPRGHLHVHSSGATRFDLTNTATGTGGSDGVTFSIDSGTGGLNINQRESQPIKIYTADTERLRVDSSGRVGIGTSSPAGKLTVYDSSSPYLYLQNSTSGTSGSDGFSLLHSGVNTFFANRDSGYMAFETGNNERMRIDNSGKLLLGTTSATGGTSEGDFVVEFAGNSDNAIKTRDTDNTGTVNHMIFVSGSAAVGSISGTTGAASFNNLSDYRRKENDVEIADGIQKLKLLRPIRFNYISDPNTVCDGFFAHEVTPAVPTAVTGAKDAVDSEGEIDPQMLDASKLVPLLTAALQEAIAKIETLEAKVAALEAQ